MGIVVFLEILAFGILIYRIWLLEEKVEILEVGIASQKEWIEKESEKDDGFTRLHELSIKDRDHIIQLAEMIVQICDAIYSYTGENINTEEAEEIKSKDPGREGRKPTAGYQPIDYDEETPETIHENMPDILNMPDIFGESKPKPPSNKSEIPH